MIVTLDGQRLSRSFPPGPTVRNLIDELQPELGAQRLVVSIAVDGRQLGQQELDAGLALPLGSDVQVDFESGDRLDVVRVALRELSQALHDAGAGHHSAAQQLQAGQVADAVQQVGELIQVWTTCRDAIVQCSGVLGRNLLNEDVAGAPVAGQFTALTARLREMRDALESRDMVLLADLLQYEMPQLCEEWAQSLATLAERVAAGARPN